MSPIDTRISVFCLVLTTATLCFATDSVSDKIDIIPWPVSVERSEGIFQITSSTLVTASNGAQDEARKFIEMLKPAMGYSLPLKLSGSIDETGVIAFRLDDSRAVLGEEGYQLDVTSGKIMIQAQRPAGLFYGIQTLLQLMPPAIFSETKIEGVAWDVPCVKIVDYPRFHWRGLLLDPARHFIAKADVLRFIDTMAMHKFNSLQLHLTDDQGWRIEIEKYPKLTEIGGWRSETLVGHARNHPMKFDGKRHGGYYTQADIREMVSYAAARHIRIVPEIEMPGHAAAAISAYPFLGVFPERQKDLSPRTYWGVSQNIFAPRDRTIAFLQDVLTEVMELFPSLYIHVGGDEAIKDQWRASEEIQAIIRAKGLNDEEHLQGWFIEQMDAFLTGHGRRLIGWDEILQGGLAPGATVMSWRGEQGGIAAANAGHDVIMAPTSHTYLDYYQGTPAEEPLAIGGNLPLKKVYGYDPIPDAIAADRTRHVLGVQGQLWSEYIATTKHLQYMAYPRATALAEVAWSPESSKDYEQFLNRLRPHLERLKVMGVNYRPLD